MKSNDLIPEKDELFNTFQRNLISAVVNNSVAWNIPAAEVTALKALQGLWNARWKEVKSKLTRTPLKVQEKNNVRKEYEARLRIFIKRWLRFNAAVSNSDLVGCGIKPYDTIRTRRALPNTVPHMSFEIGTWTRLKIYFRQPAGEDGTTRKGKPEGIARIEFTYSIGNKPAVHEDCNQFISATRSPYTMTFSMLDAGKKLYISGRWVNTANKPGTWSQIYEVPIP